MTTATMTTIRAVLIAGVYPGRAAAFEWPGPGSAVARHEPRRRSHMPPLDIETALDWRGRTVVDRDGDKIGKFDELYLDDADRPAWAAVTRGLFGMRQTFVPLSEARPDGDVLQVPFDKDTVKDAPSVDPDAQLSPEEEDLLYRHHGVRGGGDDGEHDQLAPADDAPVAEPTATDAGEREREREAEATGDG